VYEARVRGVPDDHALERLAKGVTIEGRRTAPGRVRLPGAAHMRTTDQTTVELSIHEGRHRQVRKMFDAIGHPVVRLKRVRIGPIEDPEIPSGHWRDLTPQEIARLHRAAGVGQVYNRPPGSGLQPAARVRSIDRAEGQVPRRPDPTGRS
jgi:23S rRNA pseudouridine2605 synthase